MLVILFVFIFGLLFVLPAALFVFGGIVSLVVAVDKYASKRAPVAFAAFFAGFGYWAALLVSGVLFGALLMKGFTPVIIIMLTLAAVGGFGGGLYGHRLGAARRRRYAHLDG